MKEKLIIAIFVSSCNLIIFNPYVSILMYFTKETIKP